MRLTKTILASALLVTPAVARADCDDVLPAAAQASAPAEGRRNVTAEDIARLRDIGQPDATLIPPESPLAVSPDGRTLAFVISRPVPKANSHCRALVVVETRASAKPRIVDRGGEFIELTYALRGLMVHPGYPDLVVPVWSPDGRFIAFRKRVGGKTQAWIAAADGSGARAVGHFSSDVDTVGWSPDGKRLIAGLRPDLEKQEQAIEAEALKGFLYDDRYFLDSRPALKGPAPRVFFTIELATGGTGEASAADTRHMGPHFEPGVPAALVSAGGDGRHAWISREGASLFAPMRLHAELPGGKRFSCAAEVCSGSIPLLLWAGEAVIFVRREGWAKGTYTFYRWVPGKGEPRRVLATEDVIQGCVWAGEKLACLAENSSTPRQLVLIDPSSGARQLLFDPNPEFSGIKLGEVRRMPIRNTIGLEGWGDLVLPPDYKGGRLPLVVVQYHSDGFLRGGTGDDYPIHAFAGRGLAVLSIERPAYIASLDPSVRTYLDVNAANAHEWGDRKSLLSAIETGLRQVIDLGIADPDRIGITGLSDGATSTQFALINSDMFAAAAMSTCCIDPQTWMTTGGPRATQDNRDQGYPWVTKPNPGFWQPLSLAQNAARLRVPILMQLADQEYRDALETWTALTEQQAPVEMYVFPNENHNKWQPAHRLAVYRRSIDWFDFWLAGRRDPDPAKKEQYRRWEALKVLRDRPRP